MNVTVIIPVESAAAGLLGATLDGICGQEYESGAIETFVVRVGDGSFAGPYGARNFAVSQSMGEVLLFTEPGCVPDPHWISAHVSRLRDGKIAVSVGHVAPAEETRLLRLFRAYEETRDAWVFSGDEWQYYFGRPKNMAIARTRFATHGPFADVMRGADSLFVQRLARELSCDEIGLAPDAIVRQTSVRGLPSCLRDRFGHARALAIHRSSHSAPIPFEQRVRLFRESAAAARRGPAAQAAMLATLGAGILTFKAGGVTGRWTRRLRGLKVRERSAELSRKRAGGSA